MNYYPSTIRDLYVVKITNGKIKFSPSGYEILVGQAPLWIPQYYVLLSQFAVLSFLGQMLYSGGGC